MRLLVTGFGPFPGIPRNPSAAAARRAAASRRWRLLGVEAQALILPTTYAALDEVWAPALAEAPDVVLMLGVAGRARRFRVERRGVNRLSPFAPDAAGERPPRPSEPGTAFALRTRAHVEAAVLALRRRGLAAEPSRNAGRYLCNAAYRRALAASAPALFIHIPRPGRGLRPTAERRVSTPGWHGRLAAALVDIGLALVRQERNAKAAAKTAAEATLRGPETPAPPPPAGARRR